VGPAKIGHCSAPTVHCGTAVRNNSHAGDTIFRLGYGCPNSVNREPKTVADHKGAIMRTQIQRALALALLMLLAAATVATAASVGTVDDTEGPATITRKGTSVTAETGTPVMENDVLATGPKGRLSVMFEDKTRLVLGESSKMTIDQYVYSGKKSGLLFDLSQGMFRTVTGKIVEANPEGFNMRTPLATVGIRGSDVFAHVESERNRVGALSLGQGHVLQLRTGEASQDIGEGGLYSRIGPDGSIGAPKPIPPLLMQMIPSLSKGKRHLKPELPNTPKVVVPKGNSNPRQPVHRPVYQ
jgi:hypothetical protein